MNKEIQKALLDKSSHFIDQAAQTLGQGAAHVYQVLVKQQFVEGLATIISIVLSGTLIIISLSIFFHYGKKNWSNWDDDEKAGFVMGGGFLLLVGFLVISIASNELAEAIKKLINPEFYAIKFIFESVK